MTILKVSDIEIEVTKKNIKNVYLSVHPPNGQVRISAPNRMTVEAIRLFVVSKLPWIKKQKLRFENQEGIPEREFVSGEGHYYFGVRYILNIIYIDKYPVKVKIRNNKYMDLYIKKDTSKEKRVDIMKEWYRQELKKIIPPMIEGWERIIGVKVEDWGVKQMKTRWGTCNTRDRRIWLNLELAKKPIHCLEYIVVHEIAHLIERGHGSKFKALMDEYYPNWRNVKAELNGVILQD